MTWVAPVWGHMVRIETTVPLADHSDETLWRATQRAIENAVQRAKTLGLRCLLDRRRVGPPRCGRALDDRD
jgi:hypothetical protein